MLASIGSCLAMAMYGAEPVPPPPRCPPRIPLSLADHAVLPPVLPPPPLLVERLLDRFVYEPLFLLLAGAFAFDDVFDVPVLRLLFVVFVAEFDDAAVDVEEEALFLLPSDALVDSRDFLLLSSSSPFLLANLTPFTPDPEPPNTSLRPLMHAKSSDDFRLPLFVWNDDDDLDDLRCHGGTSREAGEGNGLLSTSDSEESESPSTLIV